MKSMNSRWASATPLLVLIGLCLAIAIIDPKFLSPRNLSNLSLQSIVTAMLALGLVPVLIIRQIDMSVAAVSAVAATIAGTSIPARSGQPYLA